MTDMRLGDYLDHIRQAAIDAQQFVQGMTPETFKQDIRTQRAVVMSLVIMGEAATKIMDRYGDFVAANPDMPWRSMRGMRNRIAHGYFEINLDVVWDTVCVALPRLVSQIDRIQTNPR